MKRIWLALAAMLVCLTLLGCPPPTQPGGTSPSPAGPADTPGSPPPPVGGVESPPPPPEEPPYEAIEVTQGGTVSGTITVLNADKIPPIKPAEVTRDQQACGTEIESEVLQLKGKALKNALVFLEDIEKGKKGETSSPEVAMERCRFAPHLAWALRGSSLHLKNADPHAHEPHVYVHDNTNDTLHDATLEPGATATVPLGRSGLMRLNSDTHTWMQGWLYVSPHPYVAITDADGKFKLTDVPAGRYTMIVWHEGWDGQDQIIPIEVKAGASTTQDAEFDGELFQVLAPSGSEKQTPAPKQPSPGITPAGNEPVDGADVELPTPAPGEVDEEPEADGSPSPDGADAGNDASPDAGASPGESPSPFG